MKKYIILALTLLLVFSMEGCAEKNSIPIDVSSVESITVEFFSMGQTTEGELTGDALSDWIVWAESLSGTQVSEEEAADLQRVDGGESYHFNDGEQVAFTYILHGSDEQYVVAGGTWYKVNNPSNPPIEIE